ncbi:MAG: hypothetical protein V3V07_07520 [candidate division NC10 bacterium]|jgi:hypothetical protein
MTDDARNPGTSHGFVSTLAFSISLAVLATALAGCGSGPTSRDSSDQIIAFTSDRDGNFEV